MPRPELTFASCLAAISIGLAGCAPETTYRYSAVVPAAQPPAWDGRTARSGTLRLEGTVDHAAVLTNPFPQEHDTAVLVPSWTMGGSATLALSSHVELGARFSYASYDWMQPSAAGTMPVPGSPSSFGIGPELRVTVPLDPRGRFALGFAGNLMDFQTPYAEWELASAACASAPTCTTAPTYQGSTFVENDSYVLRGTSSESHWLASLALYPSYALGEDGVYGRAFALIGATQGLGNDGFTNTQQSGGAIHGTTLAQLGAGYGVSIEMLHLVAMVYWPLGDSSEIQYGPSVELGAGVSFDLASRD